MANLQFFMRTFLYWNVLHWLQTKNKYLCNVPNRNQCSIKFQGFLSLRKVDMEVVSPGLTLGGVGASDLKRDGWCLCVILCCRSRRRSQGSLLRTCFSVFPNRSTGVWKSDVLLVNAAPWVGFVETHLDTLTRICRYPVLCPIAR